MRRLKTPTLPMLWQLELEPGIDYDVDTARTYSKVTILLVSRTLRRYIGVSLLLIVKLTSNTSIRAWSQWHLRQHLSPSPCCSRFNVLPIRNP